MRSRFAVFFIIFIIVSCFVSACDDFAYMLAEEPNYVRHYRRGLKHYEQRRLGKAIMEYQTAIRIEQKHWDKAYYTFVADMHYHLGRAYEDQGEHGSAIAEYKEAISIYRYHALAHAALEMAYRKQNTDAEAIAADSENGGSMVAELIEILSDSNRDFELRRNAISALGQTKEPAAIPGLVETLRSEDNPDLRDSIVDALGDIGDPAAVPGLTEALSDEDWGVRNTAAYSLGKIGQSAEDSIPALIKALSDENLAVRYHAADALIKIDSSKQDMVTPVLIQLLKDGDWVVRDMALYTLREIRTPEAKKAVEDWENTSRE